MAVDLEQAQLAFREAVSQSREPSKSQILQISNMTHAVESLKEIQRMINRRIQFANRHPPMVIYNTLFLMQTILTTSSREFVAFCSTLLPAITALMAYELTSIPELKKLAKLIRMKAESLRGDLVNPPLLSERRHVVLGEPLGPRTAPPTYVLNLPLRTPMSRESDTMPPAKPSKTGLYTPTTSPGPSSQFSLNETQTFGGNARSIEAHTSRRVPLLALAREQVAKMTFDGTELEMILRTLDDLLTSPYSSKYADAELAKALTLIHHCLYWGSDGFLAHFQEMKTKFEQLRRHHADHVRSRAQTVVELLEDTNRLQRERKSREKLLFQEPLSPASITSSVGDMSLTFRPPRGRNSGRPHG